jgi:hypothetical protein
MRRLTAEILPLVRLTLCPPHGKGSEYRKGKWSVQLMDSSIQRLAVSNFHVLLNILTGIEVLLAGMEFALQ